MATLTFTGDAQPVAQVTTCTVGGTIEATDVFTITIGNKSLDVIGGSTTAATVALAIVTAFTALDSTDYPEFAEITATDNEDGTITLTANTAGVPFVVTLTSTETGGGAADNQTFVQAATTANSGPNCWDAAENWSSGAIPVDDTDEVVLENSSVDILYGLAQSAVDLVSLTIKQNYTGNVGLPKWNAGGYYEYRDDYLAVGSAILTIGEGDGQGSGRIKIDTGADIAVITVLNTGTSAETGVKTFIWKGTGATNTMLVTKGSVDVARFAGEAATLSVLQIGYQTNQAGDVDIRIGSGVTLTIVSKTGGTAELSCGSTTFTHNGGEATLIDGAITTLTVEGGTIYDCTNDTIGTVTVGSDGIVDCSRSMKAHTHTTVVMYKAATYLDPFKVVTHTNDIDLIHCGINDVTLDLGEHITIGTSAI